MTRTVIADEIWCYPRSGVWSSIGVNVIDNEIFVKIVKFFSAGRNASVGVEFTVEAAIEIRDALDRAIAVARNADAA